MKINITGCAIADEELKEYVNRATEKYGDALETIDIEVHEEDVEIRYTVRDQPFERVRRITGYLVGTLDRWNNAKKAEERDRVKHIRFMNADYIS